MEGSGYSPKSSLAARINLPSILEYDLVGVVVLCGDDREDDGPLIGDVFIDEVFDEFDICGCLRLVFGVNQAGKVDQGP